VAAVIEPEQDQEPNFQTLILQTRAELEESIERAGLARDPYRYVLGALSHTLEVLGRVAEQARGGGGQAIDQAAIVRISEAAAAAADRSAGKLVAWRLRRTLVVAASMLIATLVVGALCGYWAGRQSQLMTEAGVTTAAFRDGADAAYTWLNLMQSNDGRAVRAACAASTAASNGGRKACAIGLWVEPPANAGPRTVPQR
jgi:hypothetical protein